MHDCNAYFFIYNYLYTETHRVIRLSFRISFNSDLQNLVFGDESPYNLDDIYNYDKLFVCGIQIYIDITYD